MVLDNSLQYAYVYQHYDYLLDISARTMKQ
jgi:hypothetical protein